MITKAWFSVIRKDSPCCIYLIPCPAHRSSSGLRFRIACYPERPYSPPPRYGLLDLHIQTATPGDCQHASVVAEHQQLSLNRTLLRPVEPAQGGVLHLEANVVFLEATGAALLPWAETQSTRAGRLGDQACLAQNMSFSAGLTVTTLAFNAGLHGCNRC